MTTLLFQLGHYVKPYVRANKRFSKSKRDKGQYQQYVTAKEDTFVTVHQTMVENDWSPIPDKRPYWLVGWLANPKLYTYDLDNLLKAVCDGMGNAACGDDRYLVDAYVRKTVGGVSIFALGEVDEDERWHAEFSIWSRWAMKLPRQQEGVSTIILPGGEPVDLEAVLETGPILSDIRW